MSASPDQTVIGEKTVAEWQAEWNRLPGGFRAEYPDLTHLVGLFRAVRNGTPMYIGVAAEWKGRGLANRLADFRLPNSSAGDHPGALLIKAHIQELDLEVLVTGIGEEAAETAKALKVALLALRRPEWNVSEENQAEAIAARKTKHAERHQAPDDH